MKGTEIKVGAVYRYYKFLPSFNSEDVRIDSKYLTQWRGKHRTAWKATILGTGKHIHIKEARYVWPARQGPGASDFRNLVLTTVEIEWLSNIIDHCEGHLNKLDPGRTLKDEIAKQYGRLQSAAYDFKNMLEIKRG